MPEERISFPSLPWQPGAHPLERKKQGPLGGATLLRFEPGFADPNWCTNGHAGYVIDGTLRLEFEGTAEEIAAGEGFVIDAGMRHRASNPASAPVVLFLAPRP